MSPMHWLWLGALALMVLCLLVLLPPLLGQGQPIDEQDNDVALRQLYRSQLDDLAAQRRAGQLDPIRHDQAVEELQQRLLQELDARGAATSCARAWRVAPAWQRGSALLLSLALPLAAFVLYQRVGDPRAAAALSAQAMAERRAPGSGQEPGADHAPSGPQVEAMVAGLAQRLAEQPEDLGGWLMLARSYETLERFEASAQAYRQALVQAQRSGQEADLQARLLADLADVLASAQGGDLEGEAGQAMAAALALRDDQPKALALAGTAAWRRGDAALARQHWQRLLKQLEPGSEMAQRVREDLLRLELAEPSGAMSPPSPGATQAAVPTSPVARDGLGGRLRLHVVPGQVLPPQAIIYLVLRSAGQSRPLAVLRLPARAGDQDFRIGPAQRMDPSQPLVDDGRLQLQARLSFSGQALAQPGDLHSERQAVRLGQGGLSLVLAATDSAAVSATTGVPTPP